MKRTKHAIRYKTKRNITKKRAKVKLNLSKPCETKEMKQKKKKTNK